MNEYINIDNAPEMTMKPKEDISNTMMAYPARVSDMIPLYDEIPKEYSMYDGKHPLVRLFKDWFYSGLKELRTSPRNGIDSKMAMNHIVCIMGSFEPKHEHKVAAVAFLLDMWFEVIMWEKK